MKYKIVFTFPDRKDILHSEGDNLEAMQDTVAAMQEFINNGGHYLYLNAWPVLLNS